MLHKASSDGAVEMVRFLATDCSSVDLEARDKVNGPCVHPASVLKHLPSGALVVFGWNALHVWGFMTARDW